MCWIYRLIWMMRRRYVDGWWIGRSRRERDCGVVVSWGVEVYLVCRCGGSVEDIKYMRR